MLRISCKGDPELLAAKLKLPPGKIWRKGDPARKGKVCEDSGFQLPVGLPDMHDHKKQFAEATEFLRRRCQTFHSVFEETPWIDGCLDFGLSVPPHPAFFRRLPTELVRVAAISHLGLELSFYVCDNGPDSPTTEKSE